MADHERPSQKGTETNNPRATTAAHQEVMSSKIRWNNVANLGNRAEDNGQKRFMRKRKARSDLTEEDDEDTEESTVSASPIIIGAVCAGTVVFLSLITGLVCLWYVVSFLLLTGRRHMTTAGGL